MDGGNSLLKACLKGDLEAAKAAVREGIDKNAKHRDGLQAIHCACIGGNVLLVQWLIEQGSQINARDDLSMSPLHYACSKGHLEVVNWLMSQKVFKNNRSNDGMTPLLCAAVNGHLRIVQLLIAEKVFDFATNKDGNNALHLAYLNGHTALAEWLTNNGMDVDAKNKDGKTPIQLIGSASGSTNSTISPDRTVAPRRDETVRSEAPQNVADIDKLTNNGNETKSPSRQEKVEARRRALAQAREETEKKLKQLSESRSLSSPKYEPRTPTNSNLKRLDDTTHSMNISNHSSTNNNPTRTNPTITSSTTTVLNYFFAKDSNKTKYMSSIIYNSLWDEILTSVCNGAESLQIPTTAIKHFILMDSDNDELSPPITSAQKFWRYLESFKLQDGLIFAIYTNEEEKPVTLSPLPLSLHDNNTEEIHSFQKPNKSNSNEYKLIRLRLSSDFNVRAAVYVPYECTWETLTKEIIVGFELSPTYTLHHIVLVDSDNDELSPLLHNGTKFWKYFQKYKPEEGMYFVVHTDTNSNNITTTNSSNSSLNSNITKSGDTVFDNHSEVTGSPTRNTLLSISVRWDSSDNTTSTSTSGNISIQQDATWEELKAVSAKALAISDTWITHFILEDVDGDVLCPPLNNHSKFWKYYLRYGKDVGLTIVVKIDENIRQEDIKRKKLEDERANAKKIKLKVANHTTNAIYDVYLPNGCSWTVMKETISNTVSNINGEWVKHFVLVDSEGDVLSPPLDNASKFWKIACKYRIEENAVFTLYIDEALKAESIRLQELEILRASYKHLSVRLAKEQSKRPIDTFIPPNCSWEELTTIIANSFSLVSSDFIHHFILTDAEGDILTPPLINGPQFWKIANKYNVEEGSFFVVYEDEEMKIKYAKQKAKEEEELHSLFFKVKLSNKNSKRVDVRLPLDCSWKILTKRLNEALHLKSSQVINHLILSDGDGDILSPILNNAPQFWKFGSKLKTDEDMVFVVHLLEDMSPVPPSSPSTLPSPGKVGVVPTSIPVPTSPNTPTSLQQDFAATPPRASIYSTASTPNSISDSPKASTLPPIPNLPPPPPPSHIYLFKLSSDLSTTFQLSIPVDLSWDDITNKITNQLGSGFKSNYISYVTLVDKDGDEESPNITNAAKFYKYASKYSNLSTGASFLIYFDRSLTTLKDKKSDKTNSISPASTNDKNNDNKLNFRFQLGLDSFNFTNITLVPNCSWNDIKLALVGKLSITSTDTLNRLVLVDGEGDAQSPPLTDSIKFWKYSSRYDNKLGGTFAVYLDNKKEESTKLAEDLRSQIFLSNEGGYKKQSPDSKSVKSINNNTNITKKESLTELEKTTISTSTSTSSIKKSTIHPKTEKIKDTKTIAIIRSDLNQHSLIDVKLTITWEEFLQQIAVALLIKNPTSIKYLVVVDSLGEEHGTHIKNIQKLWKHADKYKTDSGYLFVVHYDELPTLSDNEIKVRMRFDTSTTSTTSTSSSNTSKNTTIKDYDVILPRDCNWLTLKDCINTATSSTRGKSEGGLEFTHFCLVDVDGDIQSVELDTAPKFWKYTRQYNYNDGQYFIIYDKKPTDNKTNQNILFSLSTMKSVRIEISLVLGSSWETICQSITNALSVQEDLVTFVQLVDADGDDQSPKIDNDAKFWKYAIKYNTIMNGAYFIVYTKPNENKTIVSNSISEISEVDDSKSSSNNNDSNSKESLVENNNNEVPIPITTEEIEEKEEGKDAPPTENESVFQGIARDAIFNNTFRVRLSSDKSRTKEIEVPSGCSWEELTKAVAQGLGTLRAHWVAHLILVDEEDDELSPPLNNSQKFWKLFMSKFNPKASNSLVFSVFIQVSVDDARDEIVRACRAGDVGLLKRLSQYGQIRDFVDDKGVAPIHHAAMTGKEEIVEWFVSNGVTVDTCDGDGMTALHYACDNCFPTLASWLVENGASLLARNKVGLTPLHYTCLRGITQLIDYIKPYMINLASTSGLCLLHCACDGGKIEMVKYLLSRGAHVHAQDCEGLSPLHYACLSGHLEIAEALVENGAFWNTRDDEGMSPLHYACSEGHLHIAQWLVKRGASLIARNDAGCTALHLACESNNIELVSWLIGEGIDINARSKEGLTPLHVANEAGNTDIINHLSGMGATMMAETVGESVKRVVDDDEVEVFLRAREAEEEAALQGPGTEVPIGAEDGIGQSAEDTPDSALRDACSRGDISLVEKMLLSGGVNINAQNANGSNALHFASVGGHIQLCEILLKAGADINGVNLRGFTALHFACDRKHPQLATWLIRSGAKVNIQNDDGYTAVHYTCVRGLIDLLKEIVIVCAPLDPNMVALKDITLLHCAAEQGHENIILELLGLGALVDPVDDDNKTPLHYACLRGHTKAARCLIEHDAAINSRDYKGSTPLFYACSGENVLLSQWLVAHGAAINYINRRGNSCLHLACQSGNLALTRWLVECGMNIKLKNKKNHTALDFATRGNFTDLIEYLSLKLAEPDEFSVPSQDILAGFHTACSTGNVEQVIQYINSGLDVNAANEDGVVAMHVACLVGFLGIVRRLVASGGMVNVSNVNGLTPFHCSVVNGHFGLAQWMAQQGANPMQIASSDNTSLHFSALNGHVAIVEWLIRNGSDVNVVTVEGMSSLYYAAYNGHLEVVKSLVKHGANPNLYTTARSSAFHAASAQGHFELCQYLHSCGVPIDEPDLSNLTPFLYACLNGQLVIARWLVSQGVRKGFIGGHGDHKNTALHLACQNGHTEVALWLVETGMNSWAENGHHATPISLASSQGHTELAQWLTQRGVQFFEDVMKEGKENVMLILALKNNDFDTARGLVNEIIRDAEHHRKIPTGSTPLHFASAIGNIEFLQYLVATSEGDFNAETAVRMTPVHFACIKGQKEVMKYLVSLGAKINIRDQAGNTPLTLALSNNHVELSHWLKMSGGQTSSALNESSVSLPIVIEHSMIVQPTQFQLTTPKPLKVPSYAAKQQPVAPPTSVYKKKKVEKNEKKLMYSEQESVDNELQLPVTHSNENKLEDSISRSSTSSISIASQPKKLAYDNNHQQSSLMFACLPSLTSAASIHSNSYDENDPVLEKIKKTQSPLESANDFSAALHEACIEADLEAVKSFVEAGANINAPNPNGLATPLHIACVVGNFALAQYLVKQGARVNVKNSNGLSPLHIACDRQHSQLALFLVKKGSDLTARNKSGETPLHKMATWGMHDTLNQIINLPRTVVPVLDLEVKTDKGLSMLHCAVDQGYLDVVYFLLEQRVEINGRDESNRTPLHYACLKGFSEIIDQLITCGAFINARDNQGLTPLLCACAAGHLQLAMWLVENGANVFAETELGNNCLHIACKAGNLKMAQWLVSCGLDTNKKNVENLSPTHFAYAGGFGMLVQWLVEQGNAEPPPLPIISFRNGCSQQPYDNNNYDEDEDEEEEYEEGEEEDDSDDDSEDEEESDEEDDDEEEESDDEREDNRR